MPANIQDHRVEKKYVVFGGFVISSVDGYKKWVPPYQVMKLYGVNPHECVIGDPDELQTVAGLLHLRGSHKNLIQLWPQGDPRNYKKIPER